MFFGTKSVKDMAYWQEELFIKMVAFSLPVSLGLVIPSIVFLWRSGAYPISIIDLLAFFSISWVLLFTRLPIKSKMAFAVSVLTVVAVVLIACLGSFGIGSIYLLALSVVISLLFSRKIAYFSIGLNSIIFAMFSALIYWEIVDWPVVQNYEISMWVTYSLNFLFLNVMLVIVIIHLLSGLQNTIDHEENLLCALRTELEVKTSRNLYLSDSEGHYKSLFFKNPSPMWIFDGVSLRFLQVNDAAVIKYGYSAEQFTEMTIDQIRVEPLNLIAEGLAKTMSTETVFVSVALHRKKNGEQFYAKAKCSTIPFQGKQALLVIAHDISTQIAHSSAIEAQNVKLRKIAYMQSHTVRAPLAKIKGLWSLLASDKEMISDPDLFNHMQTSIEELDTVIRGITKDSEVVPAGNEV